LFTFRLGEGCAHVAGLLFSLENIVDSKANVLAHPSLASGASQGNEKGNHQE